MTRTFLSLGVALGLECVCLADAPAEANKAAPAVAALDTVFRPIALLPAGPARVDRACADVGKLRAAAAKVPASASALPPGAVVDPASWKSGVEVIVSSLANLEAACKAPGRKRKDLVGDVRTAEQELKSVESCIDGAVDDLKPRTLTPAMKAFDEVLRRAVGDKKRKQTCKTSPALHQFAAALEAAPAGADAKKWGKAFETISEAVADLSHQDACSAPKDPDAAGAYDESLDKVHEQFHTMVLLLPVAKQ
jgi:hypothetical protein